MLWILSVGFAQSRFFLISLTGEMPIIFDYQLYSPVLAFCYFISRISLNTKPGEMHGLIGYCVID